jgi:hypothetical protein
LIEDPLEDPRDSTSSWASSSNDTDTWITSCSWIAYVVVCKQDKKIVKNPLFRSHWSHFVFKCEIWTAGLCLARKFVSYFRHHLCSTSLLSSE